MSVASGCPNCGSPLRFGAAQSLVAVCPACRSAVARRGVDLALLGKVPDLVATDTRLALDTIGRVEGRSFHVLGHLQLQRIDDEGNHSAPWDEWYCSLSDGTWCWLAEAQDRVLLTFPIQHAAPPAFVDLYPGARAALSPDHGDFAVDELGETEIASAEGELPFAPRLGARYRYADLSGARGEFATIDYGDGTLPLERAPAPGPGASDGEGPLVYIGRQYSYADVGLAGKRAPDYVKGPEGEAIQCPNCGGSLSLKRSDSVAGTCPQCGSLVEKTSHGAKLLFAALERSTPYLPVGSKGTLDGKAFEVIGWLRRTTQADGTDYYWEEYLLHGEGGYAWLTEGDGQWHFVLPVPSGRVDDSGGDRVEFGGKTFRHFQSANAAYVAVQGEFYWRVRVGHYLETRDYISPPNIASVEVDDKNGEQSWSVGRWVSPEEVKAAFKLPGALAAVGVGAAQPNPHAAETRRTRAIGALAALSIVLGSCVVAGALPTGTLVDAQVPIPDPTRLPAAPSDPAAPTDPSGLADPASPTDPAAVDGGTAPAEAPGASPVYLSAPFEIKQGPQAVAVHASAGLDQTWATADISLINDETGESDTVGAELSYYHGYEDGESWSEGSQDATMTIGGVKPGRYVLRVEAATDLTASRRPQTIHVWVTAGDFLLAPFFLSLLFVLAWPLVLFLRSRAFELRRWSTSDHPGTT